MHFASPASPADSRAMPIQTLKVGSLGTHNLLGLAKAKGARFFLASTSEVYGDPEGAPAARDLLGPRQPHRPRGVYDEAKRFAEAITMAYHRYHGVDVRIVRIFNTYGARMRPDDGRAVSNFLVQALAGKPLTVYGDGSQTRSFCYVDDEVRGLLALLDSDYVGPMNIGNPDEYTILELAQLVLELTNSSSEIVFEPLPVDDPARRRPDISLARKVLGWQPEIPLREGLARTASYFASSPSAVGDVAAVVVNYNAGDHLVDCVRSIRADGVDDIVVVDNGSHDGSLEALIAADPSVRVLRMSRNLGFGSAANRGVAATTTPYVLVMNPDTVVEPGLVKALLAALDHDPRLGVVGPRLDNSDGTLYPSGRQFPNLGDAIGHAFLVDLVPDNPFTRRYRMLDWDHAKARRVDWVSGACFLAAAEAFDAVGGFDEAYFMYLEDVDLCWRLAGRAGRPATSRRPASCTCRACPPPGPRTGWCWPTTGRCCASGGARRSRRTG